MRNTFGIFGLMVAVIVTGAVANYGFSTSDSWQAGAFWGALYAAIAISGLGGFAAAVHLWRHCRGFAKAWGVVAALLTLVILPINLSNSLGSLAGRSDRTLAERSRAVTTAKDDRAEIERIQHERAKLDPRPIGTIKAELEAARSGKMYRATDSCTADQVVSRAAHEACDAFHRLEGELATAETAARLDADLRRLRASEGKGPLVAAINPQAELLGRIFKVPTDTAMTWQQMAIVIAVELVAAFALAMFDVLAPTPIAMPVVVDLKPIEPDQDTPARPELAPIAAVRENPVAIRPIGDVRRFLLACLPREPGHDVPVSTIYMRYCRWCDDTNARPLTVTEFGEELKGIAGRHRGLRIEKRKGKFYCLDVRLAA